jgi:hypothetical protein
MDTRPTSLPAVNDSELTQNSPHPRLNVRLG